MWGPAPWHRPLGDLPRAGPAEPGLRGQRRRPLARKAPGRLLLPCVVAVGALFRAARWLPPGLAMAASSSSRTGSAAQRTAVVTGANTGIGFHAASQLAAQGYHVVLACRSLERGEAALQEMRQAAADRGSTQVSAEVRQLDLCSFASVRDFAAGLLEAGSTLSLFVWNAGLNTASVDKAPEAQLTVDGVDVVYQVNFLSQFLLTLLLLPLLRSAKGRVVSVTSVMHRSASTLDFSRAREVRDPYLSMYGVSKLAQILASAELHRRFSDVAFHCVNPGGVASDIWRNYPGWQRFVFSAVMQRPESAAQTLVQACVSEEGSPPAPPQYWNGYYGASLHPFFEGWSPISAGESLVPSEPSESARDAEMASRLWDDSLEALRAAGVEVSADGAVLGMRSSG